MLQVSAVLRTWPLTQKLVIVIVITCYLVLASGLRGAFPVGGEMGAHFSPSTPLAHFCDNGLGSLYAFLGRGPPPPPCVTLSGLHRNWAGDIIGLPHLFFFSDVAYKLCPWNIAAGKRLGGFVQLAAVICEAPTCASILHYP